MYQEKPKKMQRKIIILFLFLCLQFTVHAQVEDKRTQTIEGTVNGVLDIISGEVGEERDWDAFRNLFTPTAQMIVMNPKAPPHSQIMAMNIEEFIRYIGPMYAKDGFLEIETGITINEFNGIANVFQSYEAKNLKGTYEEKGINSLQLVYNQDRWWIVSVTWTNEDDKNPIPNKFLRSEFHK